MDNARLYHAVERAVRARDEVLAVVAHDLRNPLGTIQLEAELVRHARPETIATRASHFANAVTRTVQHMTLLIQALLDAARADAKGVLLTRRAVAPPAFPPS